MVVCVDATVVVVVDVEPPGTEVLGERSTKNAPPTKRTRISRTTAGPG
jgi:hypothetical protein